MISRAIRNHKALHQELDSYGRGLYADTISFLAIAGLCLVFGLFMDWETNYLFVSSLSIAFILSRKYRAYARRSVQARQGEIALELLRKIVFAHRRGISIEQLDISSVEKEFINRIDRQAQV